jgi:hypothetical protein
MNLDKMAVNICKKIMKIAGHLGREMSENIEKFED